ncbi:ImmA/IrrE family metallo-endopeptidase [Azospirillum rugosum]|uniref:Transcriptional regulator n=1 Tax=Azospirillum rugosum TaxID=416170 RepID=A0ABS4STQ4_9PROT|nr:ImmA/IrrE family metallo-endopeptidase [Azospirillum rugosum]MBP2295936.1 putative transcriptional regulator [Azospirillum rugosum]MDQ0531010.1 putative transcriptional regulator [Azospirillum rugosum]
MPTFTPTPCHASKAVVQMAAEKYAAHLGFKPGASIEDVVKALGGRIHYRDIKGSGDLVESIRISSVREFDIFLPLDTSPARDRFTIAHELGHLVLHYAPIAARGGVPTDGPVTFNRYLPDDPLDDLKRCEWEANWFAAAFLMASEPFTQAWRETGGNEEEVARRFFVSTAAARNRAASLKLTNA